MIITGLLNVLYLVLDKLIIFELPELPDMFLEVFDAGVHTLGSVYSWLNTYFPLDYIITLFLIVFAVDMAVMAYRIVMWIIRKIPLLGID